MLNYVESMTKAWGLEWFIFLFLFLFINIFFIKFSYKLGCNQ